MFCNNCGNEVKDNERFCTKCGARIERTYQTVNKTERRIGKKEKEKKISSPICKLIAVISSVLLFICPFVPFATLPFASELSSIYGYSSLNFGSYSIYTIYSQYSELLILVMSVLAFAAIYLVFQLTNHKKISLIGIIGAWLWGILMAYAFFIYTNNYYISYFGTSLQPHIGFFMLLVGLIGQIASMVKK